MRKIEWKKYLAWVFFLMGSIPLGNTIIRYGTDNPDRWGSLSVAIQNPTPENIFGFIATLIYLATIAFSFRLWYKLK